MRKWLISLGMCAAAWGTPLHVELHFYEGREYDCTVDHGMIWYTYRAQQLTPRRLTRAESERLEALLNKNFPGLPAELRQARVDSTWTLRYQKKSVLGTTSYSGPAQAEYRRFRAIVDALLKIAPVPGREIEKTDQRLP
ncbi:hypothetical protein JST97_08085 [bacterium]|nr:hypothetical protein [bacterium]